MRRSLPCLAAGLALLLSAPAVAQDEAVSSDDVQSETAGEEFGEALLAGLFSIFQPEPLTAEQEARLPAARAIVEKVVPPGTMGEVMGSMFDGFLGPIMDLAGTPTSGEAAKALGLEAYELDLDSDQAGEVLALLDPDWRERQERTMAATQAGMSKMMTAIEPAMRDAMTELYAVYFDERELADIDAFFSTPTGAAYARKSYKMSSDPRMVGAMMQAMPEMMGPMAEIEAEMKAATADLPPPRTFADLDAAQLARLTELTGLEPDEIEAGMERAANPEEGAFEFEDDWADEEAESWEEEEEAESEAFEEP